MSLGDSVFVQEFTRLTEEGYRRNWHERNGGNLSYRLTPEDVESVVQELSPADGPLPIGMDIPELGGVVFSHYRFRQIFPLHDSRRTREPFNH